MHKTLLVHTSRRFISVLLSSQYSSAPASFTAKLLPKSMCMFHLSEKDFTKITIMQHPAAPAIRTSNKCHVKPNASNTLWMHYLILSNIRSSSELCPHHGNLLLLGEALKCDYFTTDNKEKKAYLCHSMEYGLKLHCGLKDSINPMLKRGSSSWVSRATYWGCWYYTSEL